MRDSVWGARKALTDDEVLGSRAWRRARVVEPITSEHSSSSTTSSALPSLRSAIDASASKPNVKVPVGIVSSGSNAWSKRLSVKAPRLTSGITELLPQTTSSPVTVRIRGGAAFDSSRRSTFVKRTADNNSKVTRECQNNEQWRNGGGCRMIAVRLNFYLIHETAVKGWYGDRRPGWLNDVLHIEDYAVDNP